MSIPGDTVGVRIGVGSKSGPCAASNGIGGDGYVCYDYENSGIGLASIRGVSAPARDADGDDARVGRGLARPARRALLRRGEPHGAGDVLLAPPCRP